MKRIPTLGIALAVSLLSAPAMAQVRLPDIGCYCWLDTLVPKVNGRCSYTCETGWHVKRITFHDVPDPLREVYGPLPGQDPRDPNYCPWFLEGAIHDTTQGNPAVCSDVHPLDPRRWLGSNRGPQPPSITATP